MNVAQNSGTITVQEGSAAQIEWQRCKPWIENALRYSQGTHDIEDIEEAIFKGSMVFWSGEDCACVTEIVSYPRKRILNVFLGGGSLGELDAMEEHLILFARTMNCSAIMEVGREGFKRHLEKRGYRHAWTVMIKELRQ